MDLHSLNEKKEHIWDNLDERTKATYGRQYFDKTYENFEASLCHFATDLSPVVRAMRSGLLSMKPRQRYYVGRGAATIITIFPFLPVWLADKIIYSFGFAKQDMNPAGLQNNWVTTTVNLVFNNEYLYLQWCCDICIGLASIWIACCFNQRNSNSTWFSSWVSHSRVWLSQFKQYNNYWVTYHFRVQNPIIFIMKPCCIV